MRLAELSLGCKATIGALATVVLMFFAPLHAAAATYQGTALIEDSSGTFQLQRATSFTANPFLPRDFSASGVLVPGNYAITFELIASGTASDDPNDDQPINLRDDEYQLLTGDFSLDLVGGAFALSSAAHNVTIDSNSIFEPNVGSANLDQSASSSDFGGFGGQLGAQTSSSLGQYAFATAALQSAAASGFNGSGSARMSTSNSTGLASGATGGRNFASAVSRSRWTFTVTQEVSYTLTSHFDGAGSPGATQDSAALPNAFSSDTNVSSFFDVANGSWIEDSAAGQIHFETTDSALFTAILAFPESTDSDDLFSVAVGQSELGSFMVGDQVDFGPGVSDFVVRGINVPPLGTSPGRFPIQLSFDTATASVQATPMPEPASSRLGIAALAAVAMLLRGRRTFRDR